MPTKHKNTFGKTEHLCSKKHIEELFAGGSHSLSAYPLRAVYRPIDAPAPHQTATPLVKILVSVSKRRFKHAVDRNRIKRLIRETYRLNKQLLLGQLQVQQVDVAFIWMSDRMPDFATIESSMKNLLQRIGEKEKEDGKHNPQ